MKIILPILVLISTAVYSQKPVAELKGRVVKGLIDSELYQSPNNGVAGIKVLLLKSAMRNDTATAITNDKGYYVFENVSSGDYDLIVPGDTLRRSRELIGLTVDSSGIDFLYFNLSSPLLMEYEPFAKNCGYKDSSFKPLCHICKRSDKVIPILYGKPASSTIKKERKKEIRLGGCAIFPCRPHWYCNRDLVYILKIEN